MYICLGFTPSGAWALSGDMAWVDAVEEWDLWQVRLSDGDEVHMRPEFGNTLREVKVHTAIPADRVWWVAQRTPLVALARA